VPPLAWENLNLPWLARAARTLWSTFTPNTGANAVAHGRIRDAFGFALFFALPWMPLWAIVPFTHTLVFKPGLDLDLTQTPPALPPAMDVTRAMGIGLGLSIISLLSWATPFSSLMRAFCPSPTLAPAAAAAAWRTALYRAWIVPFGLTAFWFCVWCLPADPPSILFEISVLLFQLLPRLLILLHCAALARHVGIKGWSVSIVALVPWAVEWALGLALSEGVSSLLPPPAAESGP
jgi:hypothetical protein